MAEDMRVNTKVIRKMVLVYSFLRMVENTKGNGKMENRMDKVSTRRKI